MAENETHDFVVVGAGSAGAVVAARLSEDPGTSVLLLEAGRDDDADEVSIPAAFPTLFKTRWDWNYRTTEQKQMYGQRVYWPRMKALGGCSSSTTRASPRRTTARTARCTWRTGATTTRSALPGSSRRCRQG